MGITVVSVKEKKRSTHIFHTLFPLGSYEMPPGSQSGAIRFRKKKTALDFVPMESGARIIKTDVPRFGHNRSMRGELVLTGSAPFESLVTNLPLRGQRSAFRYSRCSPWYTAEGVIQFGTVEIIFTKGNAWGIFDWNRGIRPRADIRYWAAACGMNQGRLVGFSVGYGSVDSDAATENAFFTDGRIHKLDQVTFHIPLSNAPSADGSPSRDGALSPWRFTSNDNRLEMIFVPQQERIDRRQVLVHSVTRRQVCGSFSGKVILDDGSALDFDNITGFAERSKTRF